MSITVLNEETFTKNLQKELELTVTVYLDTKLMSLESELKYVVMVSTLVNMSVMTTILKVEMGAPVIVK